MLDKYDHRTLTIEATHLKQPFITTYEDAMNAIHSLKDKFGGSNLFGNEKDESFKSSIATIYTQIAIPYDISGSRRFERQVTSW